MSAQTTGGTVAEDNYSDDESVVGEPEPTYTAPSEFKTLSKEPMFSTHRLLVLGAYAVGIVFVIYFVMYCVNGYWTYPFDYLNNGVPDPKSSKRCARHRHGSDGGANANDLSETFGYRSGSLPAPSAITSISTIETPMDNKMRSDRPEPMAIDGTDVTQTGGGVGQPTSALYGTSALFDEVTAPSDIQDSKSMAMFRALKLSPDENNGINPTEILANIQNSDLYKQQEHGFSLYNEIPNPVTFASQMNNFPLLSRSTNHWDYVGFDTRENNLVDYEKQKNEQIDFFRSPRL